MQIIDADRPITSAFSDAAAQRRYWEIEGFARVPCGGTHIRRAGEVGSIRLKRDNVGKGKERVNILLAQSNGSTEPSFRGTDELPPGLSSS